MNETPLNPSPPPKSEARRWIAYVLPMAVFMVLTAAVEPRFPSQYVWVYIAKVALVSASLIACRTVFRDIRFEARAILPGLLVGLAVFAEWILLDSVTPHLGFLGKRAEFDPFQAIPDPGQRALFLGFRFFGLAVMVPIMEELFWRSFLLRWITDPDYEKLPVGSFSWMAFAVVAAMFGFAHPEWLAALVCAAAYALLLRQTKSLFACILAHGVTNLALGIYVLTTHNWRFW